MNNFTITDAQYYAPDGRNVCIQATIDGQVMSVPLDQPTGTMQKYSDK